MQIVDNRQCVLHAFGNESKGACKKLLATVSYADLLYQANELAQKTFRPIEVFTATALIYFVVIFGLSLCVQAVECRLAVSGDSTVR